MAPNITLGFLAVVSTCLCSPPFGSSPLVPESRGLRAVRARALLADKVAFHAACLLSRAAGGATGATQALEAPLTLWA